MTLRPPKQFNISHYFLDARIDEGKGSNRALVTDRGSLTYAEVRSLANRFGNILREDGVEPEQRVIIALPDGPEFVAALFGTLKIGAVVVMVNPHLRPEELEYLVGLTRARAVLAGGEEPERLFQAALEGAPWRSSVLRADVGEFERRLAACSDTLDNFPTHPDDAAIWLFSGGTTGRPKAVVQTHRSFANTTEWYAKGVIGYRESDLTLSVPKLFFGYATGSNLFFPFAVGGAAVLFPERCSPEVIFEMIERHRPTILVNVPTMINQMLSHPGASSRDLSALRVVTSAGECLPEELHSRWRETFGVELLDGLGTAEMWHIFISNRPGRVRPGTLGEVVPGFEVRVSDEVGHELPEGEVGYLWVRGDSRAIGYWQRMEETQRAFRGEWYVSGDMLSRDADGYFTYAGRSDDMLKVSGKWLSPQEVENVLLQHPAVREAAVVGVTGAAGLMEARAFVVLRDGSETSASVTELQEFMRGRIASYKVPKDVVFRGELPRTHLGKVDRGALRAEAAGERGR